MYVLRIRIREIVYSANPLLSGQISVQRELEQSVISDTGKEPDCTAMVVRTCPDGKSKTPDDSHSSIGGF